MTGGDASRFGACVISACAIGPLRWACRPASSAKASKTPKVDGPIRSANQTSVLASCRASSSPCLRNAATSASFPGFASRRTNKLSVGIFHLLLARHHAEAVSEITGPSPFRPSGEIATFDTVIAMRVHVLALDGVFDLGLSAVLDAFQTANELLDA